MFLCTVVLCLEESLFGAVWTEYFRSVGDESFAHQTVSAAVARETVVVPVLVLKRDKSSTTDTCDWPGAGVTSFGKEFTEAFGAERFVVPGGESLTGQAHSAMGAREALPMPRLVLVSHPTTRNHLGAFDASGSVLLLVARGAVDVEFSGDEGLGADHGAAYFADEAALVPLPTLLLHLLLASAEYIPARIASRRERSIVTVGAKNLIVFAAECLID